MRRFSILLLIAAAAPAAERPPPVLREEARVADARGDLATARRLLNQALAAQPDSPASLLELAAIAARQGDGPAAIAALEKIAALGAAPPVERDPRFASLQGSAPFRRVLQAFSRLREPAGVAEELTSLTGRTGILEGIAWRGRTGDLFLGDVRHRGIWRRDREGRVARFSAEDESLLGIFGLAIDEVRGLLWAAMSAVPEMEGFAAEMKGTGALAAFSLATSELVRVVEVPDDGREHGLGDLHIAEDGTVYATDAKAPVIWKLEPGAEELQRFAEERSLVSLQGIVRWRDDFIVADYQRGLFAVSPADGRFRQLLPPPGASLVGLHGLVTTPAGIAATQAGITPERVVLLVPSDAEDRVSSVAVLASGHPGLNDLGLITLVNQQPTWVSGAGWDAPVTTPAANRGRTVRILQTRLP
jgi:sugar lactone lactonase YvrE